jgi:hypothetical protein
MSESRMDIGFQVFRKTLAFGIMSGWPTQRSDSGGCGTRTRSPVFVRNPRCAVSSAIRRHASSSLYDTQKKHLRLLWSSPVGLVRPTHAVRSRSLVWQRAHRYAAIRRIDVQLVAVPTVLVALCVALAAPVTVSHSSTRRSKKITFCYIVGRTRQCTACR